MKLQRTNSKAFKAKIREYLVDSISEEQCADTSPEARMRWLSSEFDRVANYPFNLKKIPNEYERMADYLAGLPTGIDYENYRILKVAAEWHGMKWGDTLDDKQAERIIEGWFLLLGKNAVEYMKELKV